MIGITATAVFSKHDQYPIEQLKKSIPEKTETSRLTLISPEAAREFVIPACLNASIHKATESSLFQWICPFGFYVIQPKYIDGINLPGNLEGRLSCYYDPKNHLKIMVTRNQNDEVWVVFGAVGSALSEEENIDSTSVLTNPTIVSAKITAKQYLQVACNLSGISGSLWQEAGAFVENLQNHPAFKGKKIFLTGQCFGGSIAQYVGIKLRLPTYCLNSLQLGIGQQSTLPRENFQDVQAFIKHLSAQNDYVSNPGNSKLQTVMQTCRIKTPANFGERLLIPSAYTSREETHRYMAGSLFQYIGFTTRTSPTDFTKEEAEDFRKRISL